jgi:DNA-binding MarR family transcriptional regulator
MNSSALRLAILISVLLHLGLGLFFYLWHFGEFLQPAEDIANVDFIQLPVPSMVEPDLPKAADAAGAQTLKRPARKRRTPAPAPEVVLPLSPAPQSETIVWPAVLDSLLAVADSVARLPQVASYSVPEFFPVPIPLVPFKEYPKRKRPTLFPMEKLSGNPGVYTDRAAEEQYRRGSGQGMQPGNLLGLAAEGMKALEKALNKNKVPPPPRIRKMPTREEMAALCAIWAKEEPTEHDIYKDLAGDIKLTADDLHAVLDGLVQQGLLEQEITSPRHEFTFVTPFGNQKVEMSRLNTLNRVYRYHSLIDRDHMMRYLQAAHYYVSTAARPDSAALCGAIRSHIQQLLQLPENQP